MINSKKRLPSPNDLQYYLLVRWRLDKFEGRSTGKVVSSTIYHSKKKQMFLPLPNLNDTKVSYLLQIFEMLIHGPRRLNPNFPDDAIDEDQAMYTFHNFTPKSMRFFHKSPIPLE